MNLMSPLCPDSNVIPSYKNNSLTFYLDYLGCRLNVAEVEDLSRHIVGTDGEIVTDPTQANVIIVNTCAVTRQAAQRSQHRIRKLHQLQPHADIAVLGCWATADMERVVRLPGVRWVLPNTDKSKAVDIITGRKSKPAPWFPGRWGHTRAFLAVQDGCNHRCTYCITRILRGPARSRPLPETVEEVKELVANGAKEVVLTGVSMGAYGSDLGIKGGLAALVESILTETAVPRLRLSSIEPWDATDNLLGLWENPRLCRQIHLPLQSGSDSVLRRMGRPITTEQFSRLVGTARKITPAMAITTDVMVGFPGETEVEFEQTLEFIERTKFCRLHVFSYSDRPGTAAMQLEGSVPIKTRKSRAKQLRVLNTNLSYAFREGILGQTLPILYQKQVKEDLWMGLTDTYVKVLTQSTRNLYNCIIDTTINDNQPGFVTGLIR